MKILRFAAIDVGSNSVRLLFMNVVEDGQDADFKKSELIRVPVRLGEDVFTTRYIRESKTDKLVHTMKAFSHLILAYEAVSYRAVGTAAMREARNGQEVIDRIRKESGISLEIISPEEEARIIFSYQIRDIIEKQKDYMYVDVGAGNTVISFVKKGKEVLTRSFDVGTVRLLHELVSAMQMNEMRNWLVQHVKELSRPEIIATGGEINRIIKFADKPEGKPLTFKELQSLSKHIGAYSMDDRVKILGFNPDRADVILHGADIYLEIMNWTGVSYLWAPMVGITDGIVHQLYDNFHKRSIF